MIKKYGQYMMLIDIDMIVKTIELIFKIFALHSLYSKKSTPNQKKRRQFYYLRHCIK